MKKSERTIRVHLTRSGIKRITMLPLDNEGVEIMKKCGNNAEEAFSDIYDKVLDEDEGLLMDFVFEDAYSEYELCVVDAETEEVIYEDDSFVPDTRCGLMSYSLAEASFSVNDDEEGFSEYVKYLRSECQTNELYLSQGFAKAWNELSEPKTESAATFVPNFMLYALSAADAKNALLMGVEESEPVTVSFYINLPKGENFDPDKLDFINIDEEYDAYSKVLQELLARDIILLNAIIYDGKIYFAGHDEIDIIEDSDEEPIFDYVDENIAHISSCREKCEIKDGVAIIPGGTKHIDHRLFKGIDGLTTLTTIVIPKSVVEIEEDSFSSLSGLTKIIVEEGNERYDSRNNCNAIIETECNTLVVGCASTIIPDTVEEIGESAFSNCGGLTSVVIPNSVTSIGNSAFSNCEGLTSVVIGNSVTSIGEDAFRDCSGLTSVVIGNSVTSIGVRAFKNCEGLTSVEIPNSVTSIGDDAFEYCSGLTSVVIGNSVTSIGGYAFSKCKGLTSVKIPNSVTSIGVGAFCQCFGLTSVEIPNSVTSIGGAAFSKCKGLTSVEIPNSVTSIGDSAFKNCEGLISVEIPNSVTSIGDFAFSGCSGLTKIIVEEGNERYDSRNNCNAIIETECNTLVVGCASTVIPDTVEEIGGYAFSECKGLTSVEIPNSVTSIGYSAFENCEGLTSVVIPNSVTSIGGAAFYKCKGLTSVEIPNSVTSIGGSAFSECKGLTSVEIPNSVTSIGYSAFSECKGLTSVEIPNSVTSIGYDAFMDCTNLASVHISDIAAWCKITFVSDKSNPLFYAHHLYKDGKEITNLEIPKGVTVINKCAFNGCTGLTSVTIPEGVTSIGEDAFADCSALATVTLPKGVNEMPDAFLDCTGITTINIPAKKTDYYKERLPEELHQFIVEMEPVKKAKKKDAETCYRTAQDYYYGKNGKNKDDEAAAQWYLKAAEQGHVESYYCLGSMLKEVCELEDAIGCFQEAAELGHAEAQYELAVAYSLGLGIEQNHEESMKWYRKAAEQGHEGAIGFLEELEERVPTKQDSTANTEKTCRTGQ